MRKGLIYFFAGIGILFLLYWIQLTIRYPVAYDITEGVLFHRAVLLAAGGNIYPFIQSPPYFVTPYTPLYVILIAGLIKVFGPVLWLGRIVSLVAFFGTILIAADLIKDRCGSYLKSLFYMLLLLTSYHIISNASSFSLQWIGIFFSLLGLYLLSKRPFLAFFIMSIAVITKQSQLLAPIAALILITVKDWRRVFEYGIFFCACVVAELIILSFIFGSAFYDHIVTYTVGTYDLMNLTRLAGYCLIPYLIFIIIGGIVIYKRFMAADADLLVIYLVLNTLWLLAASRLGSDSKYFLEFYVALFMVVVPVINLSSRSIKIASIIQLIILCVFTSYMLHWNGLRVIDRDKAVQKLVPILKDLPQDVIVEDPFLAVASGHRLYFEAFPMTELAKKGLWDQRPFVEDIKRGLFNAAVLQFDIRGEKLYFTAKERFTKEMREGFRLGYEIKDRIGPYYLYRPKGGT